MATKKKAAPRKTAAPKKTAAPGNTEPNAELEELKATVAMLVEQNKKLLESGTKSAESKSKKGLFVLQMVNEKATPVDAFVKHIPLVKGIDPPKFRIAGGRHDAHEFTKEEAAKFIKEPGQSHFVVVEA